MFFYILLYGVLTLLVIFLLSQVVLPLFCRKPLFWLWRCRPSRLEASCTTPHAPPKALPPSPPPSHEGDAS